MIYFIASGNAVKIGYTMDIRSRVCNLKTANHSRLVVLGVMDGDLKAEAELHAAFADYRLNGEWFVMNHEIAKFIEKNCRPYLHEYDFAKVTNDGFEHVSLRHYERGNFVLLIACVFTAGVSEYLTFAHDMKGARILFGVSLLASMYLLLLPAVANIFGKIAIARGKKRCLAMRSELVKTTKLLCSPERQVPPMFPETPIANMRATGMTWPTIARKLRCSIKTAQRRIKCEADNASTSQKLPG